MKPWMRRYAMHFALVLALLTGCAVPPKTNTAPDLFPNAMIAEPIQMRQGYTHITQPFEITSKDQAWEVSLGFVRREEVLPYSRLRCLVRSRLSQDRYTTVDGKKCVDDEPGIHARWELLNARGDILRSREFDNLIQSGPSQWSKASITIALGGYSDLPVGAGRLRLTILRDFPELDAATPYVLIDKPFFRRR